MKYDTENALKKVNFQKGSPFLEDANQLIGYARESGIIEAGLRRAFPFATQCLTRADVQRSHFEKDGKDVFQVENIYGMFVLLGTGLGVSVISLLVEIVTHKRGLKASNNPG